MTHKKLIEGVDFNFEFLEGLKFKVFTEKFLLDRGYCCINNCKNCPYKNKKNNNEKK